MPQSLPLTHHQAPPSPTPPDRPDPAELLRHCLDGWTGFGALLDTMFDRVEGRR